MTEETLFEQARVLPHAERAAFLDHECSDPALRARVEALLAADAAPDSPLDGNAEYSPTASYRPATTMETEGTLIAGRYKLRQPIGEGGMGTVWLADQTEPVKRKVALKLIRVERGQSKTILARFEAERQAIALMDHPHIAKLLDAGTTETGTPFFVMELVKGVPLVEFCDRQRLTIPQRLNLFMQICSAVQHAHQKGIIHRDLKPSNILVESHDGKPLPKVIDFGLAKATTGLQLTDQSVFTAFGSVLGTPLYMAPEQANFSAIDVDTRADVYALGVILYELLTGTTPLTKETLKKAALDELLRLIREQEAPTPSSRLSSAISTPSVAASRQLEPTKLSRFVKGELDWIVLKALAKDRERRYETASGFARDIERFLNHEPVQAGPPSASYRFQKFVRRNRPQVIAAGLVLLALVTGVVGTTLGLIEAKEQARLARAAAAEERQAKLRETDERHRAEANEQRAKDEKAQAVRNLAYAREGNELLGSVFTGLDPKANYATVADLRNALQANLKKAVRELDGSAIGDPLTVAEMQNTLGMSLLGLGEAELAIAVFEKALATRTAQLGPDHPTTLTSMNNLAEGYHSAGKLDLALPLFEETLKLWKAKPGLDLADALVSMGNLAEAYLDAGKLELALPLFEETLELMKVKLGPDHSHTLTCMNGLAVGYQSAGKPDLALPLFEETYRLMKAKFGPGHPHTLVSMNNLAGGYQEAGKLDLALPLLKEALEMQTTQLGPYHPNTLTSMGNLAFGYRAAGKLDLALSLYEETLMLMKAKLSVDHPNTLRSMNNLAEGYRIAGKLDLALPLFEETLKLKKAKLGPHHPDTLTSMGSLAACHWSLRQLDKSVPLFEEMLAHQVKQLGRQHPDTLRTVANLGVNYKDAGQVAQAIPLLEEAYGASKKFAKLRWVGPPLLDAYAKAGQPAEAAQLIDELLADSRQSLPKDSPQLAGVLAQFGGALLAMKGFTESEPLLRECLAIREKTQPNVLSTFNTQSLLGGALLGQKKYVDAEPLLLKGYEGLKAREKTIPPQGATRLPEALDRLIELYTATNQPDEVEKWQSERAKYPVAFEQK